MFEFHFNKNTYTSLQITTTAAADFTNDFALL